MYLDLFPAKPLREAFQGGKALYDQRTGYRDPVATDFWQPARTTQRGVLQHDPERARPGLTLYTSSHDQRAYLIDMDGNRVHEWALRYSQIWRPGDFIKRPMADGFTYIEKAHLFPNGDLLALYTAIGDTPWGYGLVKMDANSRVIWKYAAHAHHDFDFDDDGNIYVLTQEIRREPLGGHAQHLTTPRIDDYIVKLSPDGREIDKLWLMDVFAKSPFGRRLMFVSHQAKETGDYLHTNSIHVLREPVPGLPQSRAGQVLVSMREVNTVALVDIEMRRIVRSMAGPWMRQHDAQFLPNGRLLLFDNEGDESGFGASRVLELDPVSQKVLWSYGGRPDQPLDSVARSSQTRLDNGNTLIVESLAGRLIEVTPEGEIVWEFVNPVRGGMKGDRIPIIFWVERVDPAQDLTAEFRRRLAIE